MAGGLGEGDLMSGWCKKFLLELVQNQILKIWVNFWGRGWCGWAGVGGDHFFGMNLLVGLK